MTIPQNLEINFSEKQLEFISSTHEITAFVGSFGSGKTVTNLHKAIQNRLRVPFPKYQVIFYEPSHELLETAAYPTLFEILPLYGLEIDVNCTFIGKPKVLTIPGYGAIRFLSLTDASKIMASNCASIHIDEFDRIRESVMTAAFNQLFGRLRVADSDRQYFFNMCRVNLTGTPEGFKFAYKHFDPAVIGENHPRRKLIKADVWSNPFIDVEDFVAKNDHLPEELKRAYFHAEFVNLERGSVYKQFDRNKHVIDVIYNIEMHHKVYIGCDFNIQHMAAVIAIEDDQRRLIVIDEIVDAYDTEDLVKEIHRKVRNLSMATIYPDASGRNRHSSSSTSDIGILQNAGFYDVVYNNSGNPRVRDTINSCNIAFNENKIILSKKCKKLISALEQQTYDQKGEPDKSSGIDHIIDSFRYLTFGRLHNENIVKVGYRAWGL